MLAITLHSWRVSGQYWLSRTSSTGTRNRQPPEVCTSVSTPASNGSPSSESAAVPSPRSVAVMRGRCAASHAAGSARIATVKSRVLRADFLVADFTSRSTSLGKRSRRLCATRSSRASMSPAFTFTSAMALASVTPSSKVTSRASISISPGSCCACPCCTMATAASSVASGVDVS